MIRYIGDDQPENLEKYIPLLQAISAAQYQLSLLLLTLTYYIPILCCPPGNKIGFPIACVMWDYYACSSQYEQLVITPNSVLYIYLLFDEPFM